MLHDDNVRWRCIIGPWFCILKYYYRYSPYNYYNILSSWDFYWISFFLPPTSIFPFSWNRSLITYQSPQSWLLSLLQTWKFTCNLWVTVNKHRHVTENPWMKSNKSLPKESAEASIVCLDTCLKIYCITWNLLSQTMDRQTAWHSRAFHFS